MTMLKEMIRDEGGQTTTEYGLLLGFLGLAVVATMAVMRTSLRGIFTGASDELTAASAAIGVEGGGTGTGT